MSRTARLPLELKLAQTAFTAAVVPVYWRQYGAANFLWFSDVALLASVPALWLEHRLLASTQAVAVLVPEIIWTVDFLLRLFSRPRPGGLAGYMFDPKIPAPVRALSLFHLWLPSLLVWMVARLGYDRRALPVQMAAGSVLLVVTSAATSPRDNINWVFGFGSPDSRRRGRRLVQALVLFPLLFYLPAHMALSAFRRR